MVASLATWRAWRSRTAVVHRSAPCPCVEHYLDEVTARLVRGASLTTWVPPRSPTNTVSTSVPIPTPVCRPSRTWCSGEALHRDSLGSEQFITPGQVNLMTAGQGVSHSEEATGHYEGDLHGIQLWIAQPDATRHAPAAFEHHAQLPRISIDRIARHGARRRVPRRTKSGTSRLRTGRRRACRFDSEPFCNSERTSNTPSSCSKGRSTAMASTSRPGSWVISAWATTRCAFDPYEPTRAMLLGGEPFESEILMWWNFVARSRDEIDRAYDSWQERRRALRGLHESVWNESARPPPTGASHAVGAVRGHAQGHWLLD